MSQQYNKKAPAHPSYCRDCYEWISWDKEAMATLKFKGTNGEWYTGTKRPLNLAKTDPHTCKKDANGKVIIMEEHKRIVEEEIQNKANSGVSGKSSNTSLNNYPSNSGSSDVKILIAEAINKIQELDKKMDTYIKETKDSITKTEKIVEAFVSYNPTGNALNSLIDVLLKKIDASDLKPVPASELKK